MAHKTIASDRIRMAHAASGTAVYATTADLVKSLAANPIIELIVSFVLIERLQQEGVLSQVLGTAMEAGIAGIITAQQLAPLAPALASGGQAVTGIIGSIGALAGTALLPGPPLPP